MKKNAKIYKLQNENTFSELTFDSKDEFFTFLEFENNKARLSNQQVAYQIDYLENEQLINFTTLNLPFEGTVEEKLKDFHLPGFSKKEIEDKQDHRTVVKSDKDKQKYDLKKHVFLNATVIGNLLCLVSLVMLIFGWHTVMQKDKHLNDFDKYFQEYTKTKSDIDIFSRYFLVAVYSDDIEELLDFYEDKEIIKSNIKKGKVTTVNVSDFKKSADTFLVTCLINVQTDKGILFKRVSFEVQKNDTAIMNYYVISEVSDELLKKKEVK